MSMLFAVPVMAQNADGNSSPKKEHKKKKRKKKYKLPDIRFKSLEGNHSRRRSCGSGASGDFGLCHE